MGVLNKCKQGVLQEHQDKCEYRPKKCDHCNELIPMVKLDQHYEECERFPVKCEQCEFEIRKSEIDKHSCITLLSTTVKTQQTRITQLEKEVSDLLKCYHSMQEYLGVLDSRVASQAESRNINKFAFKKSKKKRKKKNKNFNSSQSKSLNNTQELVINDRINTPKATIGSQGESDFNCKLKSKAQEDNILRTDSDDENDFEILSSMKSKDNSDVIKDHLTSNSSQIFKNCCTSSESENDHSSYESEESEEDQIDSFDKDRPHLGPVRLPISKFQKSGCLSGFKNSKKKKICKSNKTLENLKKEEHHLNSTEVIKRVKFLGEKREKNRTIEDEDSL